MNVPYPGPNPYSCSGSSPAMFCSGGPLGGRNPTRLLPSKHWKIQRLVGRAVGLLTWLGTVCCVAASCSRRRCSASRYTSRHSTITRLKATIRSGRVTKTEEARNRGSSPTGRGSGRLGPPAALVLARPLGSCSLAPLGRAHEHPAFPRRRLGDRCPGDVSRLLPHHLLRAHDGLLRRLCGLRYPADPAPVAQARQVLGALPPAIRHADRRFLVPTQRLRQRPPHRGQPHLA